MFNREYPMMNPEASGGFGDAMAVFENLLLETIRPLRAARSATRLLIENTNLYLTFLTKLHCIGQAALSA
jgi:hypothetical protein